MADMTLDQILSMAEQLSPSEQAVLLERLQPASTPDQTDDDRREWGMMLDQMCGGAADDPM